MKITTLITSLIFYIITIQSYTQNATKGKNALGPNDFPELINANIPGAPKLGYPQLIMGDSLPLKGEGMGWAAPAVFDWNDDGKKDLLIGEFASGREHGISTGNFVRVYQNKGTDGVPKFNDDFYYAYEVDDLKESSGTPLSIYTWCCLAFTPRFADLNNDGYSDLLTGQYSPGYITWFRGSEDGFLPGVKLEESYDPLIASQSNNYSLPVTDPKGTAYWIYSSAAFGDFDNDGDYDMILGGQALRIAKNIGTKSDPKFGKRELLFDEQGKSIESTRSTPHEKYSTVPYVIDWDQDGVLDILLTDSYNLEGSTAITYFRGLKAKKGLQFEVGIPLFIAKNGGKAFPGSWLNVYVADWNNDGVNDLLIGTSVAILNGTFNHELSWKWEHDTGIVKKDPLYDHSSTKRTIAFQIKAAEENQIRLGFSDDEMEKKGYSSKNGIIKHYYGNGGYQNKTLVHQGYVYVMLGEKRIE